MSPSIHWELIAFLWTGYLPCLLWWFNWIRKVLMKSLSHITISGPSAEFAVCDMSWWLCFRYSYLLSSCLRQMGEDERCQWSLMHPMPKLHFWYCFSGNKGFLYSKDWRYTIFFTIFSSFCSHLCRKWQKYKFAFKLISLKSNISVRINSFLIYISFIPAAALLQWHTHFMVRCLNPDKSKDF